MRFVTPSLASILGLYCATMPFVPGYAEAAPASATSKITLDIGPRVGATLTKIDSNGPSAFDPEGTLWLIQAVGGNPASVPWRVLKGSTQDDLVYQYEFVPDEHWPRPHGDDNWWAEGLWIDPTDGRWYVVMHTEFNYNKYSRHPGTGYSLDRMSAVTLATSRDQGRTWTNLGEIISSDHPSNPKYWTNRNYWRQGPGDPSLYVDGRFFYVYYNSRWNSRDDINDIYSGVRVARCPLGAKMARSCWTKWYLGKWSTPGIGGHDSDVFNENYSDTATVFWSKSRNMYVSVTTSNWRMNHEKKQEEYNGFISTATDLNTQNWTKSIFALDIGYKGWYSWPIDPITGSRYVMETDHLRWCAGDFGGYNGRAEIRCYAAKLTDPPQNPTTKAPHYPPESVDDFSPGWDRVRFPHSEVSLPR